jgi:DNA-directed RNA polymerase omega subunit
MLVKPPLEELLKKAENRYTLAILVAKRARQLVDGAQPLTDSDSPNLVTLACEEIAHDRVRLVRGHVNPHIPLRPEIEAARQAARNAAFNISSAEAIREELDQIVGSAEEEFDESDAAIIVDEIEKNIEAQQEAETTESEATDDLAEMED